MIACMEYLTDPNALSSLTRPIRTSHLLWGRKLRNGSGVIMVYWVVMVTSTLRIDLVKY
jgi:hypothetical protein